MSQSAERGFTLIEILVALAVFAVIALISYRGLDTVMTTKARLDQEMRFWRDMGLVFDRLETDFSQIAPTNRIDSEGTLRVPLRAGDLKDQILFEMTRFDSRRDPIHVGYRLQDNKLELLLWPLTTKGVEAAKPEVFPLLKDVESCNMSFLDEKGHWWNKWPGDGKSTRPQGVRLELTITGRGTFERVFSLL